MKKIWTRRLAALLAAVMVCALLPLSALAGWGSETLTAETPVGEEALLPDAQEEAVEAAPAEGTKAELAAASLDLPGYTRVTSVSQLNASKHYLIVAADEDGALYALKPTDSESASGKAGDLVAADGTPSYVAKLTVSGDAVSAKVLGQNDVEGSAVEMSKLHYSITATTDGYQVRSLDTAGLYVGLTDNHFFTTAAATLTITARQAGGYTIHNGSANRTMDFNKKGGANQFNGGGYGTDFWGPRDQRYSIYLYSEGVEAADPSLDASNWTHLTGCTGGSVAVEGNAYKFTGVEGGYSGNNDTYYHRAMNTALAAATGDKYVSFTMEASGTLQFGFALRATSNKLAYFIGHDSYSKWYTQSYNGGGNGYGSFYSTAVTENQSYEFRIQWNDTEDKVRIWINGTEYTPRLNGSFDNVPNTSVVAQFAVHAGGATLKLSNLRYTGDGKLDTQLLDSLIVRVQGMNNNNNTYTTASWDALTAQLTAAQAVKSNASSTQAQVDAAVAALQTAIDGLIYNISGTEQPTGGTTVSDWTTLRPADGTTTQKPFVAGMVEGSNNYRIPALITLRHQTGANAAKNGRLVAAIDARWNILGDANSLDTVASWSDDGGANWHYHFANYFGDSTNVANSHGACFIDPVLVEGTDGTVYMMVDLWPGGIALNTAPKQPDASTGYVKIGSDGQPSDSGTKRLVLYTTNDVDVQEDNNWSYYVGAFDGGYAPIYFKGSTTATGYYVDEYYYLYHNKGGGANNPANDKIYCQRLANDSQWVQQNVFFWNSVLHVRAASYLWITKSVDGGETWSAPTMANTVRDDTAKFYGVGPGSGLSFVAADDQNIVMLPAYIWMGSNESQRASFLYSSDGGKTWARSEDATGSSAWSSESCLVQLDATTVRHFYRDGAYTLSYVDHTLQSDGTWKVGTPVDTGVQKRGSNGCQISAIKYSQKIDGKDAILVSTPKATGDRANGVLYVFLVNADKTMELAYTYEVTGPSEHYGYSCITETADGDIADLYEGTGDASMFVVIPISEVAEGAMVGDEQVITVPLYTAKTVTTTAAAAEAIETALADKLVASCTVDGTSVTLVGLSPGTKTFTYTANGQTVNGTVRVTGTANVETVSLETGEAREFTGLTLDSQVVYNSDSAVVTATVANQLYEVAKGQKGSDINFSGDVVTITDAEFTFTAASGTNEFTVAANGLQLHPGSSNNRHPLNETGNVTFAAVTDSNYPDSFTIHGGSYLYFNNDSLVWDKGGATNNSGGYYFYIYKRVTSGTGSAEIPGYEKVTTFQSGSKYLIVPARADANGNRYVLYPGHSGDNDFHSTLKVITGEGTKLTLTGGHDGFAVVVADGKRYNVTVAVPAGKTPRPAVTNPSATFASADALSVTFTLTDVPANTQYSLGATSDDDAALVAGMTRNGTTLTITFHSQPAAATTYYLSATTEGLEASEYLPITVSPFVPDEPDPPQPGQTTAPAVSSASAAFASADAKTVTFTLAQGTTDTTYKLYAASTGGTALTEPQLSVAGTLVTLTFAAQPTAATTYYLSATAAGQLESARTALTVVPFEAEDPGPVDPGQTNQPAVTNASVTFASSSAKTVTFTLTQAGAANTTYQLYAAASGGTALTSPTVAVSGTTVTLTFTAQPTAATTYYLSATTQGMTESARTALTVSPYVPPVDPDKPVNPDKPSPSGPSGGGSSTGGATVDKDPTGNTVSTTVDHATGAVTTTIQTPEGVVTQTVTTPDGAVTKTVTQPDGSRRITSVSPDKAVSIVVKNEVGEVDAQVAIPATIPDSETIFEDVGETHWAKNAVDKVAGLGLFKGTSENQFSGELPTTRGMLVTALHRLSGEPWKMPMSFRDVPMDAYYAGAVDWAATVGVVQGVGADCCEPERNVTRQELVTMLYRFATFLGLDTTATTGAVADYADSRAVSGWASQSMDWAVSQGLLNGRVEDGIALLAPGDNASRAEVAAILARFIDMIH